MRSRKELMEIFGAQRAGWLGGKTASTRERRGHFHDIPADNREFLAYLRHQLLHELGL